jgi:hypothetical protein
MYHHERGSGPPSDTVIPHIGLFPGMLGRHPGAGCRQRRATGGILLFFSFQVRRLSAGLACFPGDGQSGSGGARLQGARGRIPGQGDLVIA